MRADHVPHFDLDRALRSRRGSGRPGPSARLRVLITVRILGPRPPLVAHRRVGWNGRALWVLKNH